MNRTVSRERDMEGRWEEVCADADAFAAQEAAWRRAVAAEEAADAEADSSRDA